MKKYLVTALMVTVLVANGGCASGKTETGSGESVTESVNQSDADLSGTQDSGEDAKSGDASAAKDSPTAAPKKDSSEADKSKGDAAVDDSAQADTADADDESDDMLEPDESSDLAAEMQGNASEKAGIIVDEAERQELLAQVREGSLDMENDTFAFEEMTSYVGKPESGLVSLIGADGHPDGFATKLFGEDVLISCAVDGENVSEIKLLYANTDGKLLANAISEELGDDPVESEGVRSWTYQGKAVRQQDTDEGILVTVSNEN